MVSNFFLCLLTIFCQQLKNSQIAGQVPSQLPSIPRPSEIPINLPSRLPTNSPSGAIGICSSAVYWTIGL